MESGEKERAAEQWSKYQWTTLVEHQVATDKRQWNNRSEGWEEEELVSDDKLTRIQRIWVIDIRCLSSCPHMEVL